MLGKYNLIFERNPSSPRGDIMDNCNIAEFRIKNVCFCEDLYLATYLVKWGSL